MKETVLCVHGPCQRHSDLIEEMYIHVRPMPEGDPLRRLRFDKLGSKEKLVDQSARYMESHSADFTDQSARHMKGHSAKLTDQSARHMEGNSAKFTNQSARYMELEGHSAKFTDQSAGYIEGNSANFTDQSARYMECHSAIFLQTKVLDT